ncbi:MAG: response regulator [Candidatus Lokiarchaeota archaeon]|nr:response regulator [Candidatus Lokiarchaeota archaeon]MBD3201988.1 response regulator [Candidatus Lokiarchaeota archaeon]
MNSVLIVEDELSLQELYELILSINGFKIVGKASNGYEAVEVYKSLSIKPDVVIMDHRMPIKTGLEATKEIMQIDPQARIIIATADEEIEKMARSMGIISFKSKPFSNDRLINNIRKAINNPPVQANI